MYLLYVCNSVIYFSKEVGKSFATIIPLLPGVPIYVGHVDFQGLQDLSHLTTVWDVKSPDFS